MPEISKSRDHTAAPGPVVLALGLVLLAPLQTGAQEIWTNGFESGRSCPWSRTATVETCDGRDNDCNGEIDESCTGGSACALPAAVAGTTGARVVGNGTPASCTEAALDAALADTGAPAITFDCGPAPHTIVVTSEKAITRDLVIDGGGLITLDGGGTTRILKLDSFFDRDSPLLTLQFLNLVNGSTAHLPGTDVDSGGAAVFRLGGSLVILDCIFQDNSGPGTGQDVAGGAVYSLGIGTTVISGSTFIDNSCSSGGAIGNLHNHLELVNSTVRANSATGSGGNPGNGGNGGGIYMDGVSQDFDICGAVISDNAANALGGGLFRVSNDGVGPMTIDRTTVADNVVNALPAPSQAGGLYLQGVQVEITDSTVSGNTADSSGGLFVWENPGVTTLDMTNVTIAGNHARTSLGAGLSVNQNVTGTLWQVTIAGNSTGWGVLVRFGDRRRRSAGAQKHPHRRQQQGLHLGEHQLQPAPHGPGGQHPVAAGKRGRSIGAGLRRQHGLRRSSVGSPRRPRRPHGDHPPRDGQSGHRHRNRLSDHRPARPTARPCGLHTGRGRTVRRRRRRVPPAVSPADPDEDP